MEFLANLCALLDHWQTLAAGMVALLAAYITVRPIKQQLKVQKEQLKIQERQFKAEQERQHALAKSQNWAARARLPDALSATGNYASQCLKAILGQDGNLPAPPSEAMEAIKQAIEFADPATAEALYELVVHFQIHNSRLSALDWLKHPTQCAERAYDAILLRCLVDALYPYARHDVETVSKQEPTLQMMQSALSSCLGLEKWLRLHDEEGPTSAAMKLVAKRHKDEPHELR